MTLFQDEVLQPYRERGRPADERSRLAAALSGSSRSPCRA